jgi:Leucine-rich repeat (LRR) protein
MQNNRVRVLLALIILAAAVFIYFNGISGKAVTIADNDLREAIKQAAGRPFGVITTSDLEKITVIEIKGDVNPITVTDLSALAHCNRLTRLSIENNAGKIEDFSPLESLPEFVELRLINNSISDISTLSSLDGLVTLDLRENQIADVSPLLSLENLRMCCLYGNPLDRKSLEEYLPRLQEKIETNDFEKILLDSKAVRE